MPAVTDDEIGRRPVFDAVAAANESFFESRWFRCQRYEYAAAPFAQRDLEQREIIMKITSLNVSLAGVVQYKG